MHEPIATMELAGAQLNWACAEAGGYVWETFHMAAGTPNAPPEAKSIDGFLFWYGDSRYPTIGVSVQLNADTQDKGTEVYEPTVNQIQSGRITGNANLSEAQRIDQLRRYCRRHFGDTVLVPDELVKPPAPPFDPEAPV